MYCKQIFSYPFLLQVNRLTFSVYVDAEFHLTYGTWKHDFDGQKLVKENDVKCMVFIIKKGLMTSSFGAYIFHFCCESYLLSLVLMHHEGLLTSHEKVTVMWSALSKESLIRCVHSVMLSRPAF